MNNSIFKFKKDYDISNYLLYLYKIINKYATPIVSILDIRLQRIKIRLFNSKMDETYEGYLTDCLLINSEEKYKNPMEGIYNDPYNSNLIELISKT